MVVLPRAASDHHRPLSLTEMRTYFAGVRRLSMNDRHVSYSMVCSEYDEHIMSTARRSRGQSLHLDLSNSSQRVPPVAAIFLVRFDVRTGCVHHPQGCPVKRLYADYFTTTGTR